jgi:Carboxypeptidase regulatory-like domain
MTMSAIIVVALALQAPQQTQPQQPTKASIEGFVVRAGTNEPLSRARVTVSRTASNTGVPVQPNPTATIPAVITDSQGHFTVRDLEAGAYVLVAQRNGFARQQFGERAPNRGGTPLNVVAGQAIKDVVFRLIPAGAVNGRVTDVTGEPLPNITVMLLQSRYDANGKRTFQPGGGSARTNDRGEYRLYSITPGRYYLSASADRGGVNGFLPSTNDILDPTYGLTYYPGVTDVSMAAAVEIQPGADLNAIDFRLSQQQLFRIRGRVIDSRTGQSPRNANILMLPRGGLSATGMFLGFNSYSAGAGTFELRDVGPGSYWLNVTSIEPVLNVGAPPVRNSVQIPIDVSNADIDNLVVAFAPGITISGRLSIEGGASFASLPDRDRIRPFFSPVAEGGISIAAVTVAEDGTFKIENLQQGEYRLQMPATAAVGMYVKEARIGQTDILSGFSVTGPISGAMDIVLSPNGAQIEGTIVDKDRNPIRGIQAVLIPDRQRDRRDLYRTTISDQNGRFVIRTVVPGDYKLFAWEDLEPNAYYDPDILRRYEELGLPVKLSASAQQTIEVKIIPAGQ